jgi:hypothetical protein
LTSRGACGGAQRARNRPPSVRKTPDFEAASTNHWEAEMTYQETRVSLILVERICYAARILILTLALAWASYTVVVNFPGMRDAAAGWLKHMTQFELQAASVKAVFKVETIAETALAQSNEIPAHMKGLLSDDILSLKAPWVERLLYVGDQGELCKYEFATPSMLQDVSYDQHLAADGLIEIAQRGTEEAMGKMRRKIAAGENWTIGKPLACYTTTLTARGRNVKTALVQFLRAGFSVASSATPEAGDDGAKVAKVEQNDKMAEVAKVAKVVAR